MEDKILKMIINKSHYIFASMISILGSSNMKFNLMTRSLAIDGLIRLFHNEKQAPILSKRVADLL